MNLRAFLLLFVGCCLLSAGCQREAAIPADGFRLTVEHTITEHDIVVSLLKIHVPHNASISVAGEHSSCMVNLADSPGDAPRDGQVVLAASRIARQGDAFASILAHIAPKSGKGSNFTGGITTSSISVPVAKTLDAYFSVSATSGDYKLDTAVEIGRLDGKPVTLVVGRPSVPGNTPF